MRRQLVSVGCRSLLAAVLVALMSSPAGAQTLPAPWTSSDIGAPAVSGSATHSNGTFTIKGAGTDIWQTSDQFRFVYQPFSGDGEIVARVASVSNTHEWAKAGVMLRESLTAQSRHASMFVSVSMGNASQRRPETGGFSYHTGGSSAGPPTWVRLVRAGDLIQAYRSSNGSSWTLVGSETIPMGETIYVGLAVTAHNSTTATTAVVDNVRITGGNTPGSQPPAVSITSPTNGAQYTAPATMVIQATASDPEGRMAAVAFYSGGTLIGTDTTAPYSMSWTTSSSGTYSLTAVASDLDGASTTSGAVSVTIVSPNGAPSVTLTSPAASSSYTAPATINMAATASDPEGQLTRVEFYNGTTLLGSDTTAGTPSRGRTSRQGPTR